MPHKDPEERREYNRKYGGEHRQELSSKHKTWRKNNPEKDKAARARYREKHIEELRARSRKYSKKRKTDPVVREKCYSDTKKWRRELRLLVLSHYGGSPPKCSCCGESVFEFLTLDHINNDGARHRRENNLVSGAQTYTWVVRNNFPDEFQVLCMNCNFGRAHSEGKICPHKKP